MSRRKFCSDECSARTYRRRRLEDTEKCVACSKRRIPGYRFCEEHWFALKASGIWPGDKNYVKLGNALMEILERQGRKCSYTGRELVVGKNASIDHVFPKARFPEKARELENLEFVDLRINWAKRDLTKEEFVDLCESVVAYMSYRDYDYGSSKSVCGI
jgi:5-methylcytosine-specific restriction endonuclease McrA